MPWPTKGSRALGASLTTETISLSRANGWPPTITAATVIRIVRIYAFALEDDAFPRLDLQHGVSHAISVTARYAIFLRGFFLAAAASAVGLPHPAIPGEAVGVDIRFGLTHPGENFASALIVLQARPTHACDALELA